MARADPSVSVVMPALNAARNLGEALESVLQQTFRDFELIVVNDGSTDATSEILHSYRDPRLRLVERATRGFAESLNEGIQEARGRYIARMDADDVSLSARLEDQYEYMETHPEISVLGGQIREIDRDGRLGQVRRKPTDGEIVIKYSEYSCPVFHPTYFVRSSVYRSVGGYRHMPPVEDYDFLLRCVGADHRIANLPQVVLYYRTNPEGMTMSNLYRSYRLKERLIELHRWRKRTGHENAYILQELQSFGRTPSPWFSALCRAKRQLDALQTRKRWLRAPVALLKLAVSVGHPLILRRVFVNHKLREFIR